MRRTRSDRERAMGRGGEEGRERGSEEEGIRERGLRVVGQGGRCNTREGEGN